MLRTIGSLILKMCLSDKERDLPNFHKNLLSLDLVRYLQTEKNQIGDFPSFWEMDAERNTARDWWGKRSNLRVTQNLPVKMPLSKNSTLSRSSFTQVILWLVIKCSLQEWGCLDLCLHVNSISVKTWSNVLLWRKTYTSYFWHKWEAKTSRPLGRSCLRPRRDSDKCVLCLSDS